jgi:HSP20 family molecular chaperone IbpA
MFNSHAQQLMEQQFGPAPGYHNNGGVSMTTTKTSRSYQSSAPNGGTVIRVGDDEEDGRMGGRMDGRTKQRTDLNHNLPQSFSTSVSSSNHLQVPGAQTVQVTTTKKTSRSSSGSPGKQGKSSKGSRTKSSTVHTQGMHSSPQVQMHSGQGQMHSGQGQMHSGQGQMHSGQGQMHSGQGQMHSGQGQMHSGQGQMHSGQVHMHSGGLSVVPPDHQMHARHLMSSPHRSGVDSLLNSPGGQSDTSWASLPSAFKGPFPPGKAPIDIQVHSPTPSDESFGTGTGSTRVREVTTELPQEETTTNAPKGKKFLQKVQRELEEQRGRWKDDVDKLTGGMFGLAAGNNPDIMGTRSYVDTSSGKPIFKATVDLSGYRPEEISVTVDKLVNKAVVQAVKKDHTGFPTKTFTQRIQLPRFADDPQLVTKLSKTGQLKLEVPLIYYFDEMKPEGKKAKSFVYQVNKGKDGKERLEILVNTGSGFRARDLKVQVHDDNRLVIIGDKAGEPKKLIKQYTLPAFAHTDGITSRLGKDGRLQVNVPIRRDSAET